MVKFEKNDYKDWEQFRMGTKDVISAAEFDLVCQLHAKIYKHKFYRLCTCNPKGINRWIKDLNVVFDNGN